MMKITSLVTWLCVAGSSIGMSASAERGLLSARPSERPGFAGGSADSPSRSAMAERGARSVTIPLETQYAVSAALGKDQTAYHVLPNREPLNHAGTSYQAANPNQHFNARFDAQGASVANDGMQWNLSVQAWGYGDTGLDRVEYRQSTINHEPSTIPLVSANRVEYHRGALTEWYINGPLGLQQGFTLQAPPARRSLGTGGPTRHNGSGCGPLTFVLNMPDGEGHSQMDADRTGLTLLTDSTIGGSAAGGKHEPFLRYGGLTALDADGVRLPAWLETRENQLLLRVDDTKARYPIAIDPFVQQAKLIAADGAASNEFGNSVALSSDGNTAIAGAWQADVSTNANQGAAYIFTRTGSSWNLQAKLTAADGAANDYFGYSVALSSDGDTAIAGAYFADVGGNVNQGAAYVFTRSGAAWSQQAKLIAADGAVNDLFGISVALSSDGDTAIAGAAWADVGGNADQGAAYVFTRSGSSGVQQVKLTAADGAANDYFGNSVALSGDGNTICAGAYLADVRGNINWGAAYVFTRSGASWSQQANLTAADGALSDHFGYAVALSSDGNTAIVGAPGADVDENVNQGAAYVFAVPPFGPDVRLNGVAGPLTVTAGSALVVTVSLNPAQYAGYPADWWVPASTPFGLYYLNTGLVWTAASSLSDLQPVYQGGLFDLQSAVVLDTTALPTGTYTFYFGVDTLNGILDPDVIYDSATVTVAP